MVTFETVALFFGLVIIFVSFTWMQFRRLGKQISKLPRFQGGAQDRHNMLPYTRDMEQQSLSRLDHSFNAMLTRQFVMAIVLFVIDIYMLNLTALFADMSFFKIIPTAQTLIFMGLFAFYLGIVWACSHGPHQKLYTSDMPRRDYVLSNILFSVPILVPWLLLSGIIDIINALPYKTPKALLSTAEGQSLFFLVFLFAVAMVGPVMVRAFWRCKPLEAGYDRMRIRDLCQRAGMGYANILYWPIFGGRMITAGVMGLIRRFRYVLVTDALLNFLRPEEIDAVIAHEIGHIKKHHLLFYLLFFGGYMLFSYAVFDLIIYVVIYVEPLFRFISAAGIKQAQVTSVMFSMINILIFIIYFRYIFGYFMRNFERQADVYVYALFENAKPLISTFEKIALTSGQPPDKPNWHHFSITERIGYLRKCETDRTWITRQDQKIKKSMAIYLVGLFLVGVMGYHLHFGEAGKKLSNRFLEKVIHQEIEKHPNNPELYSVLGRLCHNNENYEGTIAAYEKSLALKPDNPDVLNNLAWLFATCEQEELRNPERALVLARQAAALEELPHILDTLAESYYANGQYENAIVVGTRALELGREDPSYYEGQLEKFMRAARKDAF